MSGPRFWLTIALVAVIGAAAYWLGREAWGAYHRRALDEAFARRDFDRAQAELDRCLWLWPARAELHLVAARLARRQGRPDEARRHLRFCRADPELAVLVGLEESLLAIQAGDFAGSSQLDAYARHDPNSLEALLIDEAQIRGSLAALDVPRAREYLARWMDERKAPADQAEGFLWQGSACLLVRDVPRAAEHFRRALEANPQHHDARLSLAQLLTESDPDAAAEHLVLLRRTRPQDDEVLYQFALVQRNLGRMDVAAQALDELLARSPEHIDALVLHGRIAFDRNDLDAAGQWLRRAERLEPKHRAVLLAMIEYLRLSGKSAEAAKYQERMDQIAAEVEQHAAAMLKQRREAAAGQQSPAIHGPIAP